MNLSLNEEVWEALLSPSARQELCSRSVKKHQTKLTDEIDSKIISLYALGMSYADIKSHIADMYCLEVSSATISSITDKLIPELKEWQQRPLDEVYPFVWLDAIHYKVKDNGRYVSKAIYTILGLNTEGHKELLGLYLSESEGANYWLGVLTDLQNRGIKDILIACIDGLKGFPQLCVIHQIRNSLRYFASKEQKEFANDLKPVYRAVNKEAAELALDKLDDASSIALVLRQGEAVLRYSLPQGK